MNKCTLPSLLPALGISPGGSGQSPLAKQFGIFRQYFYFAANLNLDVCLMLRRLISLEPTVRIRFGFSPEVDNRWVGFFGIPINFRKLVLKSVQPRFQVQH